MRYRTVITKNTDSEPSAEIDLTPMLDVVFIMLIFFIVTATFIKEAGIDVNRPPALTREAVKNQKILVAINAADEIWINKNKVDPRSLKAVIERMVTENPNGALVIQQDLDSTAKTYAQVYDAALKAGVQVISLAADEI